MNNRRLQCFAAFFLAAACFSEVAQPDDELFSPPGQLEPSSGSGNPDPTVYSPGMRFPVEQAPAYLNSQVYRPGGNHGPTGGNQCHPSNYSYPWRDNFCEKRSWDMPLCPSGKGHQGQDIRPATCEKNRYWAVAVDDGVIAQIGTYSVTLQTTDGTLFRYLHLAMDRLAVKVLDSVKKGGEIGRISNYFGGSSTTTHLHFDVKSTLVVDGKLRSVFVPPYASLVESYKALLKGAP